jgi:hypothetical protein
MCLKLWKWIKKQALSILSIMLLVSYIVISYRTYVIQQKYLEVVKATYQLTLHLEELIHQNDCIDKILEVLGVELMCK